MSSLLRFTILVLVGITSSVPATAQQYPARPIRMLIGFPPGGGTDIVGRIVAQKLSENLGQQIIAENRGGATGMVAAELAARAAPDGYTIMMAHIAAMSILPSLYPKMAYDTAKDFAPITLAGIGPNLLVVHPSLPVRSVKDLIALAKARPGQLHYASPGSGSVQHLSGELFKLQAKVDMLHIPYKGSGQSIVDLIAGHVQLDFDAVPVVIGHARQGRLRALAVTSPARWFQLPEVPTVAESGVPGYQASSWNGVAAPAKTPRTVIERLNREVNAALADPAARKRLSDLGVDVHPGTPEALRDLLVSEIAKWKAVIERANIPKQ